MEKIWNWLVVSSADPNAYSLTIKGTLLGIATVLTMLAGFGHIQLGDLTPLVDGIVQAVQAFLALVSSVVFVVGLVRKIYRTANGTHLGIQ